MEKDKNLNTEVITAELIQYIIIDNIKESSILVRRKIDALLCGRKFAVDLFVRKEAEVDWNLKADNSFYTHHILKDGKVLYERS